jgi:hypothetical protein
LANVIVIVTAVFVVICNGLVDIALAADRPAGAGLVLQLMS